MEEETNLKDYKFTLKWKQSAKGDWYCEGMSIKADSKEDLLTGQEEIVEVMRIGRGLLI